MIKKFLVTVLLIISVLGIAQVSSEGQVQAADMARFNPGRIIDDRVFTDTSTMNVQQIQNFLNTVRNSSGGQGSPCLKNYVTDKPLGSNTYGGPVSAAQAIYDVSQMYGLNPQVILVTLQKEQGSITSTSCVDRMYRNAMGFGCPDTAPCDSQWFGLSKQLFQGARHLKGFYNNSLTYVPFKVGTYYVGWHPNSACGGTNVNIQTRGTAALYSYTPYQPNAAALASSYGTGNSCSSYGNRNFFSYFSDWFGSPTGELVRSIGDPTVYLIGNNLKHPIGTEAILNDFGILGPVSFVDQSYLNSIPTGPALTRMVGSTADSTLYLIVSGIKLPFTSCEKVADYGFSCGNINRLTPNQLALFINGPAVTSLLKSNKGSTVFFIQDGKKRPIGSWQDLVQLNVGFGIIWLTEEYVNSFPTGDAVVTGGSLIKSPNSATVYAVNEWDETQTAFIVPTFNHTVDLGLGATVKTVSQNHISKFTVNSNLRTTIKCGSVHYLGSEGVLYPFDETLFSHFGYTTGTFLSGADICNRFTISQTEMTRFILNNGTIFYIENGTKRPFTSYAAFLSRGGGSSTFIKVSDNYAKSIPNGSAITS